MKENSLQHLNSSGKRSTWVFLSDGSTNKETAEKLNISVRTVETHAKI
jgi:DNA-binding NarL/FixJ family response regulator